MILSSAGNSLWQANVLNNLGYLQHLRGDYETAASTLEKALQHARIAGSPRLEAYAYTDIGDLYRDLQAADEAREAYRHAYDISERIGERFLLIYLTLAEAAIYRMKKDYEHAHLRLDAAWQRARDGGSQYEQSLCAAEDGALKTAIGKAKEAVDLLQSALAHFQSNGYQLEAARACLYLSFAEFDLKSATPSSDHLQQAFRLIGEPEKQQPLITVGLWEKKRIETMKTDRLSPGCWQIISARSSSSSSVCLLCAAGCARRPPPSRLPRRA